MLIFQCLLKARLQDVKLTDFLLLSGFSNQPAQLVGAINYRLP